MGNDETKDFLELLRLLSEKSAREKEGKRELVGFIPEEILTAFLQSADDERREFEFLERKFNKEREQIVEKYEKGIEAEILALSERYQEIATRLTDDMKAEHQKRWKLIYDHFGINSVDNRRFGVDRDLKLLYEVKK